MSIVGTDGNDRLEGTSGDDVIEARGGDDTVEVTTGNDTVDGGEGEDELYLAPEYLPYQSFTLTGTSLTGSDGTTEFSNIEYFSLNYYYSNTSVDLDASAWGDNPNAADGVDITLYADFSTIIGSSLDDSFRIDGVGHTVVGGDGDDSLNTFGDNGPVTVVTDGDRTTVTGPYLDIDAYEIEWITFGVSLDDFGYNIDASATDVRISMGNGLGDDILIGGSGDDHIWAIDYQSSTVSIQSGGTDIYTGGAGADTFNFRNAAVGLDGVTITDFEAADRIELNRNDNVDHLATTFIGSAAFGGNAGEFRYEKAGGQTYVQYDSDGDGFADGTLVISNGEFDLVQFVGYYGENNLGIGVITDGTGAADDLTGGAGRDGIHGFGGNDMLAGADGNDSLYGGAGWDTLEGGEGNDYLDGGNGVDTASYAAAAAAVTVDLGSDDVQDTLGAGLDKLVSVENLTGSAFADTLTGSDAVNTIRGGADTDSISGGAGSDLLFGEEGDDVLTGGTGWDQLNGGDGDDEMHGGNGGDLFLGGAGSDVAFGEAGTDRAWLGGDNDFAYGGADNDTLHGQGGNDTLHGGGDNDILDGGGQNDILDGGAGDDVLIGSWGMDMMTGGAGADRFVFQTGHSGRWQGNADRILDFSGADGDVIDLSAIDAVAGGGDDAFTFTASGAFSGTAGELVSYVAGGNTYVAGDTDGDGTADFIIRLDGVVELTAGDFVL